MLPNDLFLMMLSCIGGAPIPPVNTVAPVVSGLTAIGSTLTTTDGTWTGSAPIVYTYQWKSGASNVGSNQNTYVSVGGDAGASITCVVTGTNGGGNSTGTSNGITVDPYVPSSFTGTAGPNTSEWNEVAWNGLTGASARYVAVSDSGANRAATSPDGTAWTLRTAATASTWQCVCFGTGTRAGVVIAGAQAPSGGASTMFMRSTDSGATWASATAPNTNGITSVCYSQSLDMFVAVCNAGTGNRLHYSTDGGVTWTAGTSADNSTWQCVRFADGRFLAVADSDGTGSGNRVMTSTNGTSWTPFAGLSHPYQGVIYDATSSHWVAVGQAGTQATETMYSADHGATWTAVAAAADQSWNAVDVFSGTCVAVSGSGSTQRAMYSTNGGVSWIALTTPNTSGWQSVVHGDGIWVAISNAGAANNVMTAT